MSLKLFQGSQLPRKHAFFRINWSHSVTIYKSLITVRGYFLKNNISGWPNFALVHPSRAVTLDLTALDRRRASRCSKQYKKKKKGLLMARGNFSKQKFIKFKERILLCFSGAVYCPGSPLYSLLMLWLVVACLTFYFKQLNYQNPEYFSECECAVPSSVQVLPLSV